MLERIVPVCFGFILLGTSVAVSQVVHRPPNGAHALTPNQQVMKCEATLEQKMRNVATSPSDFGNQFGLIAGQGPRVQAAYERYREDMAKIVILLRQLATVDEVIEGNDALGRDDTNRGVMVVKANLTRMIEGLALDVLSGEAYFKDSIRTQCEAADPRSFPAPPAPPPVQTAAGPHWEAHGASDCAGHDIGKTPGFKPTAGSCNAATIGRIAVCWDGSSYHNPYGEHHDGLPYPWCTYKSLTQCSDGPNTGEMYRCEK